MNQPITVKAPAERTEPRIEILCFILILGIYC